MKKDVLKRLREDLYGGSPKCYRKTVLMKSDIRQKLREALNIPTLPNKGGEDAELNKFDIQNLRNTRWQDIKLEDLEVSGLHEFYVKIPTPFTGNGTDGADEGMIGVLSIQLIGGVIYQPHLTLKKNVQDFGLGYKIYKKFISEFGHLYSGKGRRLNPKMNGIWDKLKVSGDYECLSNDMGDLCMVKDISDDPEAANIFRQFMR